MRWPPPEWPVRRLRGDPSHRGPPARGPRHRRSDGSRRIAASTSSTAPACGRASSGARPASAIPLHAPEHFYLVTEPIEGLAPDLPGCALPDEATLRPERGRQAMVGFFEPSAKPGPRTGSPMDAFLLPADWDHLEPGSSAPPAASRLRPVGIQLFFNGPESFTPDDRYLLGEAPGCGTLRRGRLQLGRLRVGWRRGSGRGRAGRRRRAADGSLGRRHPPLHAVPGQPRATCAAGPRRRSACSTRCTGRSASRRPSRGIRDRPARPPGAAGPASAGRGLGARQLVRDPWAWTRATSTRYGAPELVPVRRRRASRRPRRRRPLRPDVVRQDPAPGPRRRGRAQAGSARATSPWSPAVVYTPMLNERGGIESDLTVTRLDEAPVHGRHHRHLDP